MQHKAASTKIMSTSFLMHWYWESEFVQAVCFAVTDFCTSGKRSKAAGTVLPGGIRTGAPKPTGTGIPGSPETLLAEIGNPANTFFTAFRLLKTVVCWALYSSR